MSNGVVWTVIREYNEVRIHHIRGVHGFLRWVVRLLFSSHSRMLAYARVCARLRMLTHAYFAPPSQVKPHVGSLCVFRRKTPAIRVVWH